MTEIIITIIVATLAATMTTKMCLNTIKTIKEYNALKAEMDERHARQEAARKRLAERKRLAREMRG